MKINLKTISKRLDSLPFGENRFPSKEEDKKERRGDCFFASCRFIARLPLRLFLALLFSPLWVVYRFRKLPGESMDAWRENEDEKSLVENIVVVSILLYGLIIFYLCFTCDGTKQKSHSKDIMEGRNGRIYKLH